MSVSLTSAIKVCKFNTANASRVESDRFLSSDNSLCIMWDGKDTYGRPVCVDSFYTKRPGCDYSTSRIAVENNLRPQYSAFITLNAQGIDGPDYGESNVYGDRMEWQRASNARANLDKVYDNTGSAGIQYSSALTSSCSLTPYRDAMALDSQARRQTQASQMRAQSSCSRQGSGM